jgi:hypothetical protein
MEPDFSLPHKTDAEDANVKAGNGSKAAKVNRQSVFLVRTTIAAP